MSRKNKDEQKPIVVSEHEEVIDEKIVDPVHVDPMVEPDAVDESDEIDDGLELDDESLDPFGDKWES